MFKRLDVPGGVNDEDISSEYSFQKITPLHSMFLRTLISRRSLRETEAESMLHSIIQNYPHSTQSRGNIPLTIVEEELNESLGKFGMKLLRTKAEHSGDVYINYVSAGLQDDADASKRAQSKKQAHHIASVFHCIWDRLVNDSTAFSKSEFEDMQAKSGTILTRLQVGRLGEGGGNVSKIVMQDWKASFERLQYEGWIVYTDAADRIFLGPRSTTELKEKIVEAGVSSCSVCKKVCVAPSSAYMKLRKKRAHVICATLASDAADNDKNENDADVHNEEDKDKEDEEEEEEEKKETKQISSKKMKR
jgi:hypothetical protein